MAETERRGEISREVGVAGAEASDASFSQFVNLNMELTFSSCASSLASLFREPKSVNIHILSLSSQIIGLGCPYLYRNPDEADTQGYCRRISGGESPHECFVWRLLELDKPMSDSIRNFLSSTPFQS